jgi:hypothetical protein
VAILAPPLRYQADPLGDALRFQRVEKMGVSKVAFPTMLRDLAQRGTSKLNNYPGDGASGLAHSNRNGPTLGGWATEVLTSVLGDPIVRRARVDWILAKTTGDSSGTDSGMIVAKLVPLPQV